MCIRDRPWSSRTTVEASVGWRGSVFPTAVRCHSATLYVNGQTYNGSVSNPWYSTKCKVSFNNIPVSYTHLDVYKRQGIVSRVEGQGVGFAHRARHSYLAYPNRQRHGGDA